MYVKTTAGRTRTAPWSATCTWPTTSGTRPRAGRCPRCCTASAARTQLDRAAIKRLVASLSKLLDPADALRRHRRLGPGVPGVTPVRRRVRPRRAVAAAGHRQGHRGPGPRPPAGPAPRCRGHRAGAVRAWSPTGRWRRRRNWPPPSGSATTCTSTSLPEIGEQACYRAMDWLHDVARASGGQEVFDQVATVLNLEVDLLFFDTTSTYFELEDADEEVARNWRGEKASGDDDADPDTGGRVPHPRQVQGQPRRPAADRDRDGRDPRRDPGAGAGAGPATPATRR